MLDSATLQPVAIAMAIYLVLANLIPKIITKPTGIQVVDDLVMYLISQQGFYTSGALLAGLVMFLTNYTVAEIL